ncbi:MAG: hypothetical protein AAGB02_01745 [Pseudomonadota bacterium]
MTKTKGVIDPQTKNPDEMFIGWAPAPAVDRRFLLGALPTGLLLGGGASWAIASNLDDPGAGEWLTGATHKVTGALITEPYPMVRIVDEGAPFGVRTVLVVAQGKCTSSLSLSEYADKPVTASGALIQRKDRQMLEVPLFLEKWLEPQRMDLPQSVVSPEPVSLGAATFAGTIMDSKCFFGVMRPGRGKTHKACAALCIRGGIPPSFWVRGENGREYVMLMTDTNGGPMSMDILPLVADPVTAKGEVVRVGDILQFRADASAYKRI